MNVFWLMQSVGDIPGSLDWLHASEIKVFSRFKFEKKKNDWLLGRWTAKNAVKFFLRESFADLELKRIEVTAAEDGAPEVFYNGLHLPVFISLSHSFGAGFCVVTLPGIQLGCDLEKIETRSEALIKDHFTQRERMVMTTTDENTQSLWGNIIWSAKESTLKALRLGLRVDTQKTDVEFSPGEKQSQWNDLTVTYLDDGNIFHGSWQFSSEYVFTVVSERDDITLIKIVDLR